MKAFDRMIIAACIVAAVIFAGVNIILGRNDDASGRQYRVDAARAAAEMEKSRCDELDLTEYPTLTAVTPVDDESVLLGGRDDYIIKAVNGRLYRFDYTASDTSNDVIIINITLGVMTLLLLIVLLVVRNRVLKPFFALREVPYELSKGNLTVPIGENRHRMFGRFTWGMNMLRDNLEKQKIKEMDLQAEKKKLIISLSHDIKIPLSAIKLYAKALEKGLYDESTRQETAARINGKADEIENYVSQIVKASNDDFLALDVKNGEFFLSDMIGQIETYYADKLSFLGTGFTVEPYTNCLLRGDGDRGVEVLQNIMENAIKYGDGRQITVRFSDEEDCRLITVRNSGCTLAEDELPHIFDSFYRGTNVGGKAGSGLGLYICRTLMRKMNGEIFASCRDGEMSVTAVFPRA